ncbi:hypothetical protein [Novosphingobium gossypii]|uniref:hypothetical protein n=1 Tax=Novosphingobium gossypii TaxID=1604774 RepID=UPI003D1BE8F7
MTTCESLVHLDRKLSRAMFSRRGIKLTADDLDLLASLGMPAKVAQAKAKALEDEAKCRQLRVVSTNGGRSGSISSVGRMENQQAIDGTSGGTMPGQGASSGEARARQMFGRRANA